MGKSVSLSVGGGGDCCGGGGDGGGDGSGQQERAWKQRPDHSQVSDCCRSL